MELLIPAQSGRWAPKGATYGGPESKEGCGRGVARREIERQCQGQLRTNGQTDVAELLLAQGAEVNARTNDGVTPLMLAARKGHRDVAELLLTHKADLTARDNYGFTAFHMAADRGHAAMVELLLANQADVGPGARLGSRPAGPRRSEPVSWPPSAGRRWS